VLKDISYLIFDMDGTLTINSHDFAELRAMLNIPDNEDILHFINAQTDSKRKPLLAQVKQWEYQHAIAARAQTGAKLLLEYCQQAGIEVAILTRNAHELIEVTLRACGLWPYFTPQNLYSRDSAAPKPSAEGILALLQQWGADLDHCAMVGDYIHDLAAGRNAGVFTIHLDTNASNRWPQSTDLRIDSLLQLHQHLVQ
jgi:HAD superfamily hydrolase (TIGR01549 family)